jgi:hypothetical protein
VKSSSLFFKFIGVLLLIVSVGKFYSAINPPMSLLEAEPVFRISLRTLFIIAASTEGVVGVLCLLRAPGIATSLLILWLSCLFLSYRFALYLLGYNGPCNCMGELTERLHISSSTGDMIMRVLLLFMLLGGIATFNNFRTKTPREKQLAPANT